MTAIFADRVQETFTTTGTGTISLGGAVIGYQAFSAALTNTQTAYYAATDGTNWEVGLGTYATSGNTLARTTVLASSNSGSAVSWAAGTKNIWLDLPANILSLLAAGTTGSGNVVLATSPTLVTPALGTPVSGNLSNCTNIPGSIMTPMGVDSIILATYSVSGAINAGTSVAASTLVPQFWNSSITGWATTTDSLSGTWQPLQRYNSNSSGSPSIGLWQRLT